MHTFIVVYTNPAALNSHLMDSEITRDGRREEACDAGHTCVVSPPRCQRLNISGCVRYPIFSIHARQLSSSFNVVPCRRGRQLAVAVTDGQLVALKFMSRQ